MDCSDAILMRTLLFVLLFVFAAQTTARHVDGGVVVDSNQYPLLVISDGQKRWRVRLVPKVINRDERKSTAGRPDWTGKRIEYRVLGRDIAGVFLVELLSGDR